MLIDAIFTKLLLDSWLNYNIRLSLFFLAMKIYGRLFCFLMILMILLVSFILIDFTAIKTQESIKNDA